MTHHAKTLRFYDREPASEPDDETSDRADRYVADLHRRIAELEAAAPAQPASEPVWNDLWKRWEIPDPKNAALSIPVQPVKEKE